MIATMSYPIKGSDRFSLQRFHILFESNAEDIADFWGNPRHQKYEINRVVIRPNERRYITPFTDISKPVIPFIPDEIKPELTELLRNEWKFTGQIVYEAPGMN